MSGKNERQRCYLLINFYIDHNRRAIRKINKETWLKTKSYAIILQRPTVNSTEPLRLPEDCEFIIGATNRENIEGLCNFLLDHNNSERQQLRELLLENDAFVSPKLFSDHPNATKRFSERIREIHVSET